MHDMRERKKNWACEQQLCSLFAEKSRLLAHLAGKRNALSPARPSIIVSRISADDD